MTLQLPTCHPLKLFSVASLSEQINLKNKILLRFVQSYQRRKEVPYMEMSGDNVQKRKESPFIDKSRHCDQKRYVYK